MDIIDDIYNNLLTIDRVRLDRWADLLGLSRGDGESDVDFRKRMADSFKKVNDGIQSETER